VTYGDAEEISLKSVSGITSGTVTSSKLAMPDTAVYTHIAEPDDLSADEDVNPGED
jgi:hypothetical protein